MWFWLDSQVSQFSLTLYLALLMVWCDSECKFYSGMILYLVNKFIILISIYWAKKAMTHSLNSEEQTPTDLQASLAYCWSTDNIQMNLIVAFILNYWQLYFSSFQCIISRFTAKKAETNFRSKMVKFKIFSLSTRVKKVT